MYIHNLVSILHYLREITLVYMYNILITGFNLHSTTSDSKLPTVLCMILIEYCNNDMILHTLMHSNIQHFFYIYSLPHFQPVSVEIIHRFKSDSKIYICFKLIKVNTSNMHMIYSGICEQY